jgi:hypothetical protein
MSRIQWNGTQTIEEREPAQADDGKPRECPGPRPDGLLDLPRRHEHNTIVADPPVDALTGN